MFSDNYFGTIIIIVICIYNIYLFIYAIYTIVSFTIPIICKAFTLFFNTFYLGSTKLNFSIFYFLSNNFTFLDLKKFYLLSFISGFKYEINN